MKIATVETTAFSIPLADGKTSRLASSAQVIDRFPGVLVRIRTDDGLEGVAEAPARPFIYGETQQSIQHVVRDTIGPRLIGIDPLDTELVRELLDPPAGPAGNNCAKGAVDLALHDLIGNAVGLPSYKLLGGRLSPPVVRLSWLIGIGPVDETVREAVAMAEAGYRAFKLKVGIDVERDVETVRQLRAELGDNVLLYVDANEAWSPPEAIRATNRMATWGVAWVEDPCPINLPLPMRRRLAKDLAIPILGDNACITPADVLRELQNESVGLVSIKVARTGFTQSRRIAALAEQFGVPFLIGTQGDSAIGTLCSAHLAAGLTTGALPAEVSYFLKLADQVIVNPPDASSGAVALGTLPGIGASVDEAKLSQFAVESG